jgi:hypothetical protein
MNCGILHENVLLYRVEQALIHTEFRSLTGILNTLRRQFSKLITIDLDKLNIKWSGTRK